MFDFQLIIADTRVSCIGEWGGGTEVAQAGLYL